MPGGARRQRAGWSGGLAASPEYDGNVWELHPLVVAPALPGPGIGRAWWPTSKNGYASRGGLTLWLGSDDEDDMTSLAGVDLYADLPARLAECGT